MCKNCNQLLKRVEVTDSEFKELQERFLSNVMIGKNIFMNSSPQELKDFKDFIEMTGPYDVVVDGLNLAYAYRSKIANNSLVSVVKYLLYCQSFIFINNFDIHLFIRHNIHF